MMQPDFLDVHDLIQIARELIPNAQIRDLGLLQSAAARPMTTVLGRDAYPTFRLKVAALMHSLGRNHTLVDGNKRLAWSAGRIFCLMNGYDLRFQVDDAERLILAIAQGDVDVPEIDQMLKGHLIKVRN